MGFIHKIDKTNFFSLETLREGLFLFPTEYYKNLTIMVAHICNSSTRETKI